MANSPTRGRLVVVEGIDGAGKSTVVKSLADFLRSHGDEVVLSREPTNGPWGRKLRESAVTGRLPLDEELALFVRDRQEHVDAVINPALAAGKQVILDRYYFSTAAYQGARGADPEAVLRENERFAPAPDLVLLLDLDPTHGRSRIHERGDRPDDFEGAAYLAEVRRVFLSIDRSFIRRIDAAQSPEAVALACVSELKRILAEHP